MPIRRHDDRPVARRGSASGAFNPSLAADAVKP